jgi:hypothetical protein
MSEETLIAVMLVFVHLMEELPATFVIIVDQYAFDKWLIESAAPALAIVMEHI